MSSDMLFNFCLDINTWICVRSIFRTIEPQGYLPIFNDGHSFSSITFLFDRLQSLFLFWTRWKIVLLSNRRANEAVTMSRFTYCTMIEWVRANCGSLGCFSVSFQAVIESIAGIKKKSVFKDTQCTDKNNTSNNVSIKRADSPQPRR